MRAFILVVASLTSTALQAQTGACTCCTEEFRQFDFWVGDWVVEANGKVAGHNTVVILQDSCVIQENWTSTSAGFTGTSYNFYNQQTGKWQQVWLDNRGGNLQLEGSFVNGEMILQSKETKDSKGQPQIDRITWTPLPDGMVRQFWERSTDSGATWTSLFDGVYKRKTK